MRGEQTTVKQVSKIQVQWRRERGSVGRRCNFRADGQGRLRRENELLLQKLEEVPNHVDTWGVFQSKQTVSAKALRQVCVRYVWK